MAKITITNAENEIIEEWIDGGESDFDADTCIEANELPAGLILGILVALRQARESEAAVRQQAGY